jgi:hypothetical protein
LGALHLAIISLMLMRLLIGVVLVHAVGHVDSSSTQKACGFVQS